MAGVAYDLQAVPTREPKDQSDAEACDRADDEETALCDLRAATRDPEARRRFVIALAELLAENELRERTDS